MKYLEYVEILRRRDGARRRLTDLIDEKEELFQKTQPGAIRYDKVRVVSANTFDSIEEYVQETIRRRLDARITEAKAFVELWSDAAAQLEEELRRSHVDDDRLFVMYYLDKLHSEVIARKLHYSKDTIYYRKRRMEKAALKQGYSLRKIFGRK